MECSSSLTFAAMAGLVENLRGGATAVIDHQYIHVDAAIDDEAPMMRSLGRDEIESLILEE